MILNIVNSRGADLEADLRHLLEMQRVLPFLDQFILPHSFSPHPQALTGM